MNFTPPPLFQIMEKQGGVKLQGGGKIHIISTDGIQFLPWVSLEGVRGLVGFVTAATCQKSCIFAATSDLNMIWIFSKILCRGAIGPVTPLYSPLSSSFFLPPPLLPSSRHSLIKWSALFCTFSTKSILIPEVRKSRT